MERDNSRLALGDAPEPENEVFRTVCGICSGTCGMALTMENGTVRSIEGDTDHPVSKGHLCPKGRAFTWPNAGKVRKALAKLGFLAVVDPFMTETAQLAHLVLPCATFLRGPELWDSSHLSSEPRLGLAPKLCHDEELPTNWAVWKEIATRTGYADFFPWETEEEAMDFRPKSLSITLDDLKRMPEGYEYHRWTGKKHEAEGFHTPSGKVEIYSAELERHGYDPLPVYREPAESPASTPRIAARFPLVLTTGARTIGYLHSRFRNVPSLRSHSPEPYVEINPRTAGELHVGDGEVVTVETRRGKIAVKAKCTHGILPNVISIPHGWDQANANVLTDDIDADPVTGFPADRALLARIVKRRRAPTQAGAVEAPRSLAKNARRATTSSGKAR